MRRALLVALFAALAFAGDGHTDAVDCLAVADGLIVTSARDGLRFADPARDTPGRRLRIRGAANSLALSRDGRLLAIGTNRGTVCLFDTRTLAAGAVLPVTEWSIYAVAIAPGRRVLACCAADGTVQVWNLAAPRRLHSLGRKGERMASLAFSPDGKRLAALSRYGVLRVWDPEAGTLLGTVKLVHAGDKSVAAFLRDGGTTVVDGGGALHFRAPGAAVRTVPVPDAIDPLRRRETSGPVYLGHTRLAPDGDTAATTLQDGSIALWSVSKREVLRTLSATAKSRVRVLAFTPDGRALVHGDNDGVVRVRLLQPR